MTTKVLEVVVCDLCKKDRPAIARIDIDVCGKHEAQISDRVSYACPICGRPFANEHGVSMHIARARKSKDREIARSHKEA